MKRKISAKNAEWVALLGLVWNFMAAGMTFLVAYWNHSRATYLEGWHLLGGIFVWLLVWLHTRQTRLADEERETPAKKDLSPQEPMFEKEGVDPFSAQSRLYFFEKWVVPVATVVIGVLLLGGGLTLFFGQLRQSRQLQIANAPLSAAFLTGFAFFSLLLSKYALGMAKQSVWRYLQAGGNYLFMNALFCFLTAVLVALTHLNLQVLEQYLAFGIPLILVLLGGEMILNLILDIYRPRLPNQEPHPPYESRFLEIFTSSKGIFRTAAQTLDYQFGFNVSETWFYQFLEKTITPLILFQCLSLYLLSCLVVVRPEEQAVLERFGQPRPLALEPGFYCKWPWPFEKVYHYPVGRIETLQLGSSQDDEDEDQDKDDGHGHGGQSTKKAKKSPAILFSKTHAHEELNFITAYKPDTAETTGRPVPVNLFTLHVLVHYRIHNIFDYMYRHSSPKTLLEGIAYRELTQSLAAMPIANVLSVYRRDFSVELHRRIQQQCRQIQLGVELMSVLVTTVHPPVPVAEEFISVIGAREEMKTKILQAETYRQKILPIARAEVIKTRLEALSYLQEKTELSKAQSQAFEDFLKAYAAGDVLYLERKYLKMLEKILPGQRLQIVHLPGTQHEIVNLNLEENVASSLLQLDMSDNKEAQK